MGRPRVDTDEFRERAVRLVREWREARGVTEGGLTAISEQLGLRRETLRRWVVKQEVDHGTRPGLSTDDRTRRNSTADRSSDPLDRRAPRAFRGRADL